jgi:hypothetical protein
VCVVVSFELKNRSMLVLFPPLLRRAAREHLLGEDSSTLNATRKKNHRAKPDVSVKSRFRARSCASAGIFFMSALP